MLLTLASRASRSELVSLVFVFIFDLLSKWAHAQTAALEGCFTLAVEEVSGV